MVLSLVVGCCWELLYRGYLLWALTPRIGLVAGIVVAAAAYGAAHGFKNLRMFAGTLVSALIFTVAYALTKSLWWLMLIHCALPIVAAVTNRARPSEADTPAATVA